MTVKMVATELANLLSAWSDMTVWAGINKSCYRAVFNLNNVLGITNGSALPYPLVERVVRGNSPGEFCLKPGLCKRVF